MFARNIRKGVVRGVVSLAFLSVGAGVGVGITSLVGGSATFKAGATTGTVSFPTNANGQTYGSASNVSLDGEPSLIRAYATNGKVGYILRSQLWAADGTNVSTPAQAISYMASRTNAIAIPVFEQDGTTIIGEFIIPAVPSTPSSPPVPAG